MIPRYMLFIAIAFSSLNASSQQRYCEETFSQVIVTSNIVYGNNLSFMAGPGVATDLLMDVYEPFGDTLSERPLMVFLHSGTFLPIFYNGALTGDRNDSATVEMCKRFARRGYVVANIDYRLGWNPLGLDNNIRTGTILQAVYRGLHDAKTCVRFFRKDHATMGNTYRIDTARVAVTGQGTGGFVALAYAHLNKPTELQLLKFISSIDDASLGLINGQPYVRETILGDVDGFGGTSAWNIENHPGYSSKIHAVINLEGAVGDTSWLEAGEVPVIAFHPVNNPVTPYATAMVYVWPFGYPVVEVSGSYDVVRLSYNLGNQNILQSTPPACDAYTVRANAINEGFEGLFPLVLPDPGPPHHGQIGPWQWVNVNDLYTLGDAMGFSTGSIDTMLAYALTTNPNILDKNHAMAYIDTIVGYASPRLALALGLGACAPCTAVKTVSESAVESIAFPNPLSDVVTISTNGKVEDVIVYDVLGNKLNVNATITNEVVMLNMSLLPNGLYVAKVVTRSGITIQQLIKTN